MPEKNNALAKLAERIGGIKTPPTFYLTMDDYHRANDDLAKVQRIVAELAKVKDIKEFGVVHIREDMAIDAVENCRAIAEEGANE